MKLESSYFPELGILTALAALYLTFFYSASLRLRRRRDVRSALFLLLGSVLQLANLAAVITVFNLRHGAADTVWNAVPPSPETRWFLWMELFLSGGFLAAAAAVLADNRKAARALTNDSIAEAIMNLSSGLCFAAADGRIVLANTLIRNQVFRLTGRPLTDANEAWERLTSVSPEPDGKRPDSIFLLEADTSWMFHRKVLEIAGERYQQIFSDDISERVRLIEALRAVNEEIAQQNKRTRGLIAEIIIKKSEEEILEMQHQIHHEVGQCIVTAKMCLNEAPDREKLLELIQNWERTFRFRPDAPEPQSGAEREQEICKSAEFMGCSVYFRGLRPRSESNYRLYLSAVREALTNAVRHAKAKAVYIDGAQEGQELIVVISDDSGVKVDHLSEGVGLGVLRKKLEAAGIRMDVDITDGVRLLLAFPNEVKNDKSCNC